MDLLGALGLGANIVGGIMQSKAQAKARKRAMQFLRQLIAQQNQDFASAKTSLQQGQAEYENDPRRKATETRWQERLANPDVISAGDESVMLNQGLDQAAREGDQAGSQLSEELTKRGLGNSALGAGLRAAALRSSYGTAQGLNNNLRLNVKKTNRAARDDLYSAYEGYTQQDMARRYGMKEDLASLYGSRTYGNSALLAGVG